MDTSDYLKLKRKENKSDLERELVKDERLLRVIGEYVTDATKQQIESDYAIAAIRDLLNEWH